MFYKNKQTKNLLIHIVGGSFERSTDEAQNNGLMDAFGALTSENADVTQKSIQVSVFPFLEVLWLFLP